MTDRPWRALLFLLCVPLASGCTTEPSGPELGSGTWVLRTVAGAELPAPVFAQPFGGRYLSDTLRFEPRSLALFAGPTLERSTVVQVGDQTPTMTTDFLGYERVGDILNFTRPCPPEADCALGFLQGTLTGDELEITLPAPYRSPLGYRLVR
jgi:hypothetical protein